MNRTVKQASSLKNVIKVNTNDNILKAAQLMSQNSVGSVLVYDDEHKLNGILTERDILNKLVSKNLNANEVLVSSLMTQNLICVDSSKSVSHALFLMREYNIRHLPVLENNKVISVFSVRDGLPNEQIEADHLEDLYEHIVSVVA